VRCCLTAWRGWRPPTRTWPRQRTTWRVREARARGCTHAQA
jgi:hypothetical protein